MKKGISPVVATALLLVVAVVAVVGFNTWFSAYESKTLTGVEQQGGSGSGIPQVDSVIGSSLYIKNPSTTSLNVTSVKIAGKTCANSATVASKGITPVNVSSCLSNLTTGQVYDAVIVTNQGTYSKKFYVKSSSSTSSSFSVPTPALTPVYVKTLQGSSDERFFMAVEDSSGNIYATGSSQSPYIDLGNGFNFTQIASEDIFLIKYNSSGSVIWRKIFGNSNQDYPSSIQVDSFGNVYLSGTSQIGGLDFGNGVTTPSQGTFVTKFNPSGVAQWVKRIITAGFSIINSMRLDSANNIYIGGNYGNTLDFGNGVTISVLSGGSDGFIAKYNSSGSAIWANYFGGTGNDYVNGIAVSSTGNIAVAAQYTGGTITNFGNNLSVIASSAYDSLFIVYNSSGSAKWVKSINNAPNNEAGVAAVFDSSNNAYFTGIYSSATNVSLGNGVILKNATNLNMYLIKYNQLGVAQWAKYISSTGYSGGDWLAKDSADNIYLSGQYASNNVFNLGNNVVLNASSSASLFLLKFNSLGVAQSFNRIKPSVQVGGSYTYVSPDNARIYLLGAYRSGSIITIENGLTIPISMLGTNDLVLVKYQ